MLLERIKTPGLAHVAYLLAEGGQAVLVDPRRDLEEYLTLVEHHGVRLCYILETHRQEDFEMGSAHLRKLTDAQIVAGKHAYTKHADIRLADGEELELLGGLKLKALHTPGHTPESTCYAVSLAERPDVPWSVFTGDALFVGDTGRTDLADPERTAENAALLHESLAEKIFPLGDQALVLPAHGAGSACGGNVANRDHSTLGIERVTNAAAVKSRNEFVRYKVEERLARPPYFSLMEEVNLNGGRPFPDVAVAWLDPPNFDKARAAGIVIDTRSPEAFAGGHIPGSYSVWLDGLPRYGGWIGDEQTAVYFVTGRRDDVHEARLALGRIGRDLVDGALRGGFDAWRDAGLPIEVSGTIGPRELSRARERYDVVDVRELQEFESGHIAGAKHVHVGHLEERLAELNLAPARPVVVTCSVGHRGSLAASILKRAGHAQVFNLLGGMTAWRQVDLPVE